MAVVDGQIYVPHPDGLMIFGLYDADVRPAARKRIFTSLLRPDPALSAEARAVQARLDRGERVDD